MKDLYISLLFDFYGAVLSQKQRDVISFYYNDDLSLGEIAQNEGITRQGVRDAIKRAEQQMIEMEEKLGLLKRFNEINSSLEEIRKEANEIEVHCNNFPNSFEIANRAKKIKEITKKISE